MGVVVALGACGRVIVWCRCCLLLGYESLWFVRLEPMWAPLELARLLSVWLLADEAALVFHDDLNGQRFFKRLKTKTLGLLWARGALASD